MKIHIECKKDDHNDQEDITVGKSQYGTSFATAKNVWPGKLVQSNIGQIKTLHRFD